jgi:hypothetical protein
MADGCSMVASSARTTEKEKGQLEREEGTVDLRALLCCSLVIAVQEMKK